MRTIFHFFLSLFLIAPLFSITRAGVTLPDTLEIDAQKLILNGTAVRKKVIFKVYVAGLYLPQKEKNPAQILKADQMRFMVMHFVRSVGANKINDAWMEGLRENTPNPSQQLRQDFGTLCSWMEEIGDGETLKFIYRPGTGIEVKVREKVKGVIPGKEFADALLSCWIGPKPGPGEGFKADLLGVE